MRHSKTRRLSLRYGYARVSTAKQDYTIQVDALKAAGCEKIFTEKFSAKSTDNRIEFKRLMRALNPGDTVVVTKLDRLARSSRDLLNILHELEEGACGFVSLGGPGATLPRRLASWSSRSCPASPNSSAA